MMTNTLLFMSVSSLFILPLRHRPTLVFMKLLLFSHPTLFISAHHHQFQWKVFTTEIRLVSQFSSSSKTQRQQPVWTTRAFGRIIISVMQQAPFTPAVTQRDWKHTELRAATSRSSAPTSVQETRTKCPHQAARPVINHLAVTGSMKLKSHEGGAAFPVGLP
jgi:hypothetical protein